MLHRFLAWFQRHRFRVSLMVVILGLSVYVGTQLMRSAYQRYVYQTFVSITMPPEVHDFRSSEQLDPPLAGVWAVFHYTAPRRYFEYLQMTIPQRGGRFQGITCDRRAIPFDPAILEKLGVDNLETSNKQCYSLWVENVVPYQHYLVYDPQTEDVEQVAIRLPK